MQVRDLSNRTGFNVHLDQAFHSERIGELGLGRSKVEQIFHWLD